MTKRIEYIDAMRGFTMILVVACHVVSFCIGVEDDTPSIHPILLEFRMPTFFFISGFVLYKADVIWNMRHILSFLNNKFFVQIITTTIFFLIYIFLNYYSISDGLYSDSKLGYWFTYTLFIYFTVYSICRFFLDFCKCPKVIEDILILCIGFIFYVLFSIKSIFNTLPIDPNTKNLLSMCHWGYYLFFCIGTLFKKHYDKIQVILDTKPVIMVSLIIFFGFNLFNNELRATHINFFNLMTALTGIILVFSFFRKHQSTFTKEKYIGRCLQYIGRRTLDIYLLHYLILPVNLVAFTTPLLRHPMPLIEFAITLCLSFIVIAGCLIISSILRMSPTLAYLLFGVKRSSQR